ncbi:MAG TPA: Rieske (2Fe-2S) protein [Alphaproteobacteria bacterium]|nr:Rieske (2Fe-2S) protein [Alphaproteobacteria bacterium]
MSGYRVCAFDDLEDGQARGFSIAATPSGAGLIVVRRGDRVYGYANECPHAFTPLDWVPNQFLSRDRTRLQCATHGAQFEIESGLCVLGPCKGRSLKAVPLRVEDGAVLMPG